MEDVKQTFEETLKFYREEEKRLVGLLAALPKGKIRKKRINGEEYYYLRYRRGDKVTDEYIGKEIPSELLEKLQKRKAIEKKLKEVREAIKFLTHSQREIGGIELTEPLKEFLRIMTKEKMWNEGIEIVGAWCFALYQKFLPIRKYPLKTVDILIPYPYKGKAFNLSDYLKQLGFEEHINPDHSVYYTGFGIKIEFLAPQLGKGRGESPFIRKLGISPQMLRFMNLLFMESFELSISKGIKVRVPAPAAFMLHKILIADRRKESGKMEKDLRQAIYTAEFILKTPSEYQKLINLVSEIPRSWKKRIQKTLNQAKKILPQEESIINSLLDEFDNLPHKNDKK